MRIRSGFGGIFELPHVERVRLLNKLGVQASFLGIGVDRVDYTKGIPERFRAIERFFEKYPAYRREFTFVQIGSPSRTQIRRYQELMDEVIQEAERINRRFQTSDWKPIVFLNRHHNHKEILQYYRTADFCLVTSLHDGMNLVAKEFVASRDDLHGVLILSRFAGASHELGDALVGESIRYRADGGLYSPGSGDETRGAPHAHAKNACHCSRAQRLSLGRKVDPRVVRDSARQGSGGALLGPDGDDS